MFYSFLFFLLNAFMKKSEFCFIILKIFFIFKQRKLPVYGRKIIHLKKWLKIIYFLFQGVCNEIFHGFNKNIIYNLQWT